MLVMRRWATAVASSASASTRTIPNSSPPSRTRTSDPRNEAVSSGAQLLEKLVTGRMAEGIVDLLETIEVDEEKGQPPLGHSAVALVAEEGLEDLEEVPTIPEAGQLVGQRLAEAVLGHGAQSPYRQQQSQADHDEGGGGQPQGHPTDVVESGGEEDDKGRDGGQTGQQEAGRFFRHQEVEPPGTQPHGDGHEKAGRRPGQRMEDGGDPWRSQGRGKEVERIAHGVQAHGGGQEDPGCPGLAREQGRTPDDEGEQQRVSDGIGQVGRFGQGAGSRRLGQTLKGESSTQRGRPQPGHGTVQPARIADPPDFPAHEQNHGHVGGRVEPQPEGVRPRRARWARPPERLGRPQRVPDGPREEADSQGEATTRPCWRSRLLDRHRTATVTRSRRAASR
jgi:hypothetical protein